MIEAEHSSRFTIRHGECDSLQHLYTGSYFRLMQEAVVEALSREGKTLSDNDRVWIPSMAYLDMMIPLHMGDMILLSINPEVNEENRVSVSCAFNRLEPDGGQVLTSTGSIVWGLRSMGHIKPSPLTAASGHPESPSADLPDHNPESGSPCAEALSAHGSFPPPPPLTTPPAGAIHHSVPIGWCDISQEQVVYNARYMDTMVNAAMQAGNTYGWTWERLHEEGFVFVAKKQWLLYHASAGLSDQVEVTSWLGQVRRSSALRQYLIHRVSDGVLLAEGHTLFVTVDLNSGRPERIPEHFRQDLAPHISADG